MTGSIAQFSKTSVSATYIPPISEDPDPDALRARARDSLTPSSSPDLPPVDPLLAMLAPLPAAAAKAPDLTYATASSCSELALLLRMGRGFPLIPTATEEEEDEEKLVETEHEEEDDEEEEEAEDGGGNEEEEEAEAADANALVSGTVGSELELDPDAAPKLLLRVANSTLLRFLAGIISGKVRAGCSNVHPNRAQTSVNQERGLI